MSRTAGLLLWCIFLEAMRQGVNGGFGSVYGVTVEVRMGAPWLMGNAQTILEVELILSR